MPETEPAADTSKPILSGRGASDYERYLRTDDLLALQKTPAEAVHRDELLFQVVHQSSELWLKLASAELETATALLASGELAEAARLLGRATLCIELISGQLTMLERLDPWEYTQIRTVLGHGSGFDSPGFNRLRAAAPALGQAFGAAVRGRSLSLDDLYRERRAHPELYALAEALMSFDEGMIQWRVHHLKVVERIIGGNVVGTQGTPVELLAGLVGNPLFPELWEVRDRLTDASMNPPPAA